MPRIRTIKPEFWTDDLVGTLSPEARLLFIATWNIADDEGLLRWSAPTLKGAVFPFDASISIRHVDKYMAELVQAGLLFPYKGGHSQQPLAFIINFAKHQKINRPSPSRLPPPSIQTTEARDMYSRRDGHICHLCGGQIEPIGPGCNEDFVISLDHIVPVSLNGSDFPSNIRAAHGTCNKGRGNRTINEYRALLADGKTIAQQRWPERFSECLTERPYADLGTGIREQELGSGSIDLGSHKEREAALGVTVDLVLPESAHHQALKKKRAVG